MNFSRFFVDRPIFAAVLSLFFVLAAVGLRDVWGAWMERRIAARVVTVRFNGHPPAGNQCAPLSPPPGTLTLYKVVDNTADQFAQYVRADRENALKVFRSIGIKPGKAPE